MIDLVAEYNSGKSYEQIGREIGKSKKWVYNQLKGKITPRPAVRPPVVHQRLDWATIAERNQLAIKLYQSGIGASIIGQRLGVGKRTIYRILHSHGVPTDNNRQPTKLKASQADLQAQYDAGATTTELAAKYQVCEGTISRRITTRKPADSLLSIPVEHRRTILELAATERWSSYHLANHFRLPYQTVQRYLRQHGLSVGSGTPEWKRAVQRGIRRGTSSLERAVATILTDLKLEYTQQYEVGDFRYDFALAGGAVLIEVQGSYWHSLPQRRQRDRYKARLAAEHGKRLLVVWDHELARPKLVSARILAAVSPAQFDYRPTQVQLVQWKTIAPLLRDYHYQGAGRAGLTVAVLDPIIGEPIAGCVFTTPTRQETYRLQDKSAGELLELHRVVIHPHYQSRGFASWLIARAVKLVRREHPSVTRLVSFTDPTFGHTGTVYRASNWKLDGTTQESYWYYHRRQNRVYHKKTVWNRARRAGMPEAAYAAGQHLIKVPGHPKLRFVLDVR